MSQLLNIALEEWRYWLRSHLALGGVTLFIILCIITSFLVTQDMYEKEATRTQQQLQAEETFLAQPDRHPHRMVHYGHYVFRTPAPLSLFDPGLDSVTGQSIFLEGHRQNSAMFANASAGAYLGGLSWLTPAMMYQLFAPLLIILFGHAAIIRERESGVLIPLLAQGLKSSRLIAGKALALLLFILILLLPLLPSAAFAMMKGESIRIIVMLFLVYFIYLCIWAALSLLFSAFLQRRSSILTILASIWLVLNLLVPAIAVNVSGYVFPLVGKIEKDLTMQIELRQLSDGHNANDPGFKALQMSLFKQYGVSRIEDLPINFRGQVALSSEKDMAVVLSKYAKGRMADETRQAQLIENHAWLSPIIALASVSRTLSGTDLEHYHRFLRQAENLRFEFIQGLNRAHIKHLSYHDDINRSKNEVSSLKARVDSSNWTVLNKFQFEPAQASIRLAESSYLISLLIVWFLVLLGGLFWSAARLKP